MILFFQSPTKTVLAVEAAHAFSPEDVEKLVWAFSEAKPLQAETLEGWYVGPRREMITPWSTNAVEITQNMGLTGIHASRNTSQFLPAKQSMTRCYSVSMTV